MSDRLHPGDAEDLRDLADRSRRAARTAQMTAGADTGPAAVKLSAMASLLEAAALLADEIARMAEGTTT
jgi:hypothetical protein